MHAGGGGGGGERVGPLSDTVRKGLGSATVGFVITNVIMLAAFVVLARELAPQAFGVFAGGAVAVGIGMIMVDGGLASAIVQRRAEIDTASTTAFVMTVVNGLGATLAAAAVAPLLGLIFGNAQVTEVGLVLAPTLLIRGTFVVPEALLQRRFSVARRTVVDPLAAVAYGLTGVLAATDGQGVWSLVIATYFSLAVQTALVWWLCRWTPHRRHLSWSISRQLTRFARPVFVSLVWRHLALQADVVALGSVSNPSAVGQYRNGLRLSSLVTEGFVRVVAFVVFPALARLGGDASRLAVATVRLMTMLPLVCGIVALTMVVVGPALTLAVLGPNWETAAWVVAALSLSVVAQVMGSMCAAVLKVAERTPDVERMYRHGLLATIACCAALAWFGPVVLAVGLGFASCVQAAVGLRSTGRAIGVETGLLARPLIVPACLVAVIAAPLTYANLRLVDTSHSTKELLILAAGQALVSVVAFTAAVHRWVPGRLADMLTTARPRPRHPERRL